VPCIPELMNQHTHTHTHGYSYIHTHTLLIQLRLTLSCKPFHTNIVVVAAVAFAVVLLAHTLADFSNAVWE